MVDCESSLMNHTRFAQQLKGVQTLKVKVEVCMFNHVTCTGIIHGQYIQWKNIYRMCDGVQHSFNIVS